MKQIHTAFSFASSSSGGKFYQTLLYADGSTSCDCAGWCRRVQPDGSRTCRHVRSVIAGTAPQEAAKMVGYAGSAPVPAWERVGGAGEVRVNAKAPGNERREERTKGPKMKRMYRQGDVLIERVERVPDGSQKQKASKRIILAHGEATGHHHALELAEESDPADWWKAGDELYVDVKAPARVTHQEHGTIAVPAGRYRVRRQREYSPQEVRRVLD